MERRRRRQTQDYPVWIAGILYYHPGDSRLLIPIREGRDHVFNYAKPLATVLTASSILLPLLGAVLMIGGFVHYFDAIAGHAALIALPSIIVVACILSLVANVFLPDDREKQ